MRERQRLEEAMSAVRSLENELADATGMIELAEAEGDSAMVADAESSIDRLAKRAEEQRLQSMLSGEADANDTYLEVHAGAGGTESQDWAEMLFRMYTRWAERHGYKLQLIEESEGEGAGIKSATLLVKGLNAYGWLKSEAGVHRLVRISPFDSNARRHTSFSSVTVYPVVDQNIEIDIPDKDVRIDVYRASGRWRSACQQDRERGAHNPSADGNRRGLSDRTLAAPKSRGVLGHAALAPLRDRAGKEAGRDGSLYRRKNRYRLGSPDPLIRPSALSAR
jgi:protein subunit release factor A